MKKRILAFLLVLLLLTGMLPTAAFAEETSKEDTEIITEDPSEEPSDEIAVTGIALNTDSMTLMAGKTATLTATLTPEDATASTVTWVSSDETVATVENGVVTAVAAGKATITATAGDHSASCEVNVWLPTFENIRIYASANAYNSGTAPYSITPAFNATTYSGYTIRLPDSYSTNMGNQVDVYLVATPSQDMISNGFSGKVYYYYYIPNPQLFYQTGGIQIFNTAYTASSTPFTVTTSSKDSVITLYADGNSNKYEITVQKYNTLKSLTSSVPLSETFSADVFDYYTQVSSETESVTLSLKPTNTAATVTIGDETIASGTEYTFDNWVDGKLVLEIKLTRSGYVDSTYTLTYEKPGSTPVITSQPEGADYVTGDTANALSVIAGCSGTLSYQWYSNTVDSTENGTAISGATESAYIPSTETVGTTYYYCVVTNSDAGISTTSQTACITVAADPTPVVSVATPGDAIEGDGYLSNTGFVYNVGDTATALSVNATSENADATLSYQWYSSTSADLTGKIFISGATASSYIPSTQISAANSTGTFYFCAVIATYDGKQYTTYSDGIYVFLTVEAPATPSFTTQPVGAEYEIDDTITPLKVAATIEDGGVLSYQWYSNTTADTEGAVALEGETNTTLNLGKATEDAIGETFYFCIATNTNQGKTSTAVSDIVSVKIVGAFWDGEGTEESPYLLKTTEDFQTLADYVTSGHETKGLYFAMDSDIPLPENWEPVGTATYRFKGVFDGQGHLLTVPEGGKPLFGYVLNATVKNLNIYGKRIEGYGLIDNFIGINITSETIIDNITIKSGTSILKSGLLGSYITTNPWAGSSVTYKATITNCTVESGVVIGYDGSQSDIGSIAGRLVGTVSGCTSYATVKGVNYVGGLVGCQDNGLSSATVSGCQFHGSVEASGNFAGGIIGGGFDDYSKNTFTYASAPNGARPTILNCTVDGSVTGAECVGGITGGDENVAQTWDNVSNSVSGNSFTGTVSGSKYVGGIIGYYRSLNKYDTVSGNSYSGTELGIGYLLYLDTSYEDPATMDGTVVFNTATGNAGCPKVTWCSWKTKYNRTDDPLGADAESLCKKLDAAEPTPPTVYAIDISGTYQTEYTVGDELDLTGIILTAHWTEGAEDTTLDLDDVEISGYDKNVTGSQTVSLTYHSVTVHIAVTVVPKSVEITVTVTILGDSKHGDSGDIHGLARGGLTTWVSTTVEADTTNTVWYALKTVMDSKGISYVADENNSYGSIYISTVNGLSEFDNGANSGWMYTVNGVRPEIGVNAMYLSDGDTIVLYYTDDYTYETGGANYGKLTGEEAAEEVDKLIAAIGTVTYTDAVKARIDAARTAYNALSASEKELVARLSTLEAAEKKYAQLKEADDKAKAENVVNLIDKIDPTITEDSKDAIEEARAAYDKLTTAQKALVTNYEKLTNAETELAKLVATDEDKEKAQQVMGMIDTLDDITADSEAKVEEIRKAYDALTDIQKQLVENYDSLEAAEKKLDLLKTLGKITDPYVATGDYMEALGTPNVGSIGGEWMVIGLTRSDRNVPNVADYYSNVVKYIQENIDENERLHAAKSTDNSRLILALTALGMDITDVDGHNLLLGLNSMDFIQKQGLNGPIWALIALDSGNYPVPEGDVTRQALIDLILAAQTSDGGWAISGDEADADMTGMALTALAPYYKKDLNVLAAVDEAIECLSRMQNEDGGFSTFSDGGKVATAESCAQIIVALTALGIDPDTDARFIKDGNSVVGALISYFVDGGGFRHIADGQLDGMATEQSYYALTAYYRFLEEKTRLYDMTDTVDMGGDPEEMPEESTETTVPETTAPQETEAEQVQTGGTSWTVILAIVCIVLGGGVVAAVLVSKKRR